MPNFKYKPISDKVDEIYKQHTGKSFFEDGHFDLNIELIVSADTEEQADKIRMGVTDMRMWELIQD